MKILVFSDSHQDENKMRIAMIKHKKAKAVFFCGDGHSDIEEIQREFPDKKYFIVKGNCDWYCDYPSVIVTDLCGKKILLTHGHIHGVKESLSRLVFFGQQEKADIILFGHTHHQLTTAERGMLIMNPGSVGFGGYYGVIDIDEKSGKITAVEYPDSQYGPVVIN